MHVDGIRQPGHVFSEPCTGSSHHRAIQQPNVTVSRATTRKYMLTPRGIYEMKYFFSSHVQTSNGAPMSATAVKARLQALLDSEADSSPLSDCCAIAWRNL